MMLCIGTECGGMCVVCRTVESEAYISLRGTGLRRLPAAQLLFHTAQKYVVYLFRTLHWMAAWLCGYDVCVWQADFPDLCLIYG